MDQLQSAITSAERKQLNKILSSGEVAYSSKWQRRRKIFLMTNPLCYYCERAGATTPAVVVDHKVPHRFNATLFWDEKNWQSLCSPHHQSSKQKEEYKGYTNEVAADGWPIDINHPANSSGG